MVDQVHRHHNGDLAPDCAPTGPAAIVRLRTAQHFAGAKYTACPDAGVIAASANRAGRI